MAPRRWPLGSAVIRRRSVGDARTGRWTTIWLTGDARDTSGRDGRVLHARSSGAGAIACADSSPTSPPRCSPARRAVARRADALREDGEARLPVWFRVHGGAFEIVVAITDRKPSTCAAIPGGPAHLRGRRPIPGRPGSRPSHAGPMRVVPRPGLAIARATWAPSGRGHADVEPSARGRICLPDERRLEVDLRHRSRRLGVIAAVAVVGARTHRNRLSGPVVAR
jgi:hypothetical protein